MANRVANYEVKIFNDLREDKKLLVLDIDYTLFDHKTPAETGAELMRPHLHEFLTAAYKVFTKVGLLGVDSLWSDCTFIYADWGHSLCFFALFEDFSL